MAVIPRFLDGSPLPPPLLLRWLAAQRGKPLACDGLPHAMGRLPSLMRLSGHDQLAGSPKAFRWQAGGALIRVGGGEAEAPLHLGEVPDQGVAEGLVDEAVLAALDLARLADAGAAAAGGAGADWPGLLATLDGDHVSRPPPLALRGDGGEGRNWRAWNPLAWRRRCPVLLPAGPRSPPWGLRDAVGGLHPIQVIEGPLGRELLAVLDLGALEVAAFERHDDDPPPGALWEVSASVIDNGRLRVELDRGGLIVRCCVDGRFLPLSGPMPEPVLGGLPLGGEVDISVLESGPCRARVAVSRRSTAGVLSITYSLLAGEATLGVSATWNGERGLRLGHATAWRDGLLRCGGWSRAPTVVDQAPSAFIAPGAPARASAAGWAWLGDAAGQAGLLLTGANRALELSAGAGRIDLALTRNASWTLGAVPGEDPGRLALAAGIPGRATNAEPSAPLLRWADATGLVPWWAAAGADGAIELLVTSDGLASGRAALFPLGGCQDREAQLIDVTGSVVGAPRRSPEGDAWLLDHRPGETCLIRWPR